MALRRRRHGRRGAPGARAAEDVERRRRRVVGVGARGDERGPHARRDGRAGQPRRGPDARRRIEDVQVAQELLRVDAAEDDDVRPDRRRGVAGKSLTGGADRQMMGLAWQSSRSHYHLA